MFKGADECIATRARDHSTGRMDLWKRSILFSAGEPSTQSSLQHAQD
jgi:hypothetical protein